MTQQLNVQRFSTRKAHASPQNPGHKFMVASLSMLKAGSHQDIPPKVIK
jgi:hypothetical protein